MIKHHSYKIQNVIQKELFAAKHSIKICVAWFTNDLLFQPLLLKLDAGVEVTIITNKDEINFGENNDVDFDEFIQRGGCIYWSERSDKSRLLHHKFCIIDDSVVISGSYNWTNGAEYNNEDITIYTDEQETIKHYSDIFDKLAALLPKSKGEVKRTTHQEEQTIDLTQQLQARYCEIGEYIDGLAKVCRTIGNSRLWGFVNEQGEELIPCRYNSVEEFHGGLSFVCLGHYFGAIDKNGTEIIPFQHKSIHWRDNNFIEAYLGNDELCVYDNSGVRIDSNRIIVYTTLFEKVIDKFLTNAFILSNTYTNGKGLSIFDRPVDYINEYRYCNESLLLSIVIPNSVTMIKGGAFSNCCNLKCVTIPNSVTEIEENVFDGCSSLTSVTIPGNIIRVREETFHDCRRLTSVTLPNSVTTIERGAFEGCDSLTSVTIPNSLITIGERAFKNCRSLTNVTISDSVKTIGDYVFSGCSSLTSITIPDGITSIEDYAFSGCSSLTSITIPDSVTTIGERAFEYCTSLTSITIPNGVIKIGAEVFSGCRSLKEFKGKYAADGGRCLIKDNEIIAYASASGTKYTIPNSVKTVGQGAFSNCWSLTSVTIPDSVIEIKDGAFSDCKSLISMSIPDGVKTIGKCTFYSCRNLVGVAIPNSITSIGDRAFDGCQNLSSIVIPENVAEIGEMAFGVCGNLRIVTIPNSVTKIGEGAFVYCSNLKVVIIGSSVTSIGKRAFHLCTRLVRVNIPNSVTSIGEGAFSTCWSLTSVTIPNSVTEIGTGAFRDCRSLKEFKGKYAADGGRCLIMDNTIIAYASASGTKYTIPSSVKTIGESAFSDCSSLTSVMIPNGIIMIGAEAFRGCNGLTDVTIPDSVTEIKDNLFGRCCNIREFKGRFASDCGRSLIVDGVLNAFAASCGATEYTIPDSVTIIGAEAFWGCDSLTSVTIPEGVTSIGELAFSRCDGLKIIYCKSTTPPIAGDLMFLHGALNRKIYVPAESANMYRKAPGWTQYAHQIIGYDFENDNNI